MDIGDVEPRGCGRNAQVEHRLCGTSKIPWACGSNVDMDIEDVDGMWAWTSRMCTVDGMWTSRMRSQERGQGLRDSGCDLKNADAISRPLRPWRRDRDRGRETWAAASHRVHGPGLRPLTAPAGSASRSIL